MVRAATDIAKCERRAQLLEAALDEFFERGFAATRMEDVARRANTSKGTLYLYFKSKDELFRAIISDFAVPNLETIRTFAVSAPTFRDSMDRLAALLPSLIAQSKMPALMKVLVSDSHNFPDMLAAYRRDVLEELLALFAEMMARAKAAGEIDVDDPELAARLVVAPVAFCGLWHALFSKTPGSSIDFAALFRLHAAAMKTAFEPKEAKP